MKKTQKLLLIPLTLLIVAVSFLIYTNISKASNNIPESQEIANYTSEQDWQEGIENCIPKVANPTTSKYIEAGATNCLEQIMIESYKTQQVATMSYALQKIVDNNPHFYMLCHGVAHKTGLESLQYSNGITELLDQAAKSTVCDWGMGHGILDALAETKPSLEEFRQVSNWCDEQINDLRLYSLCVDGLGHVAWGGTDSFQEAVQWCEQIDDEAGRSMCGGGIVMQKYVPANGKSSGIPEELNKDLIELCNEWEQYVSAPSALDGCFAGAAFMYGYLTGDILNTWWDSSAYGSGEPMTSEIKTQVLAQHEENIKNCHRHTNDKNNSCEKSLANQISPRLTQENNEIHKQMCTLFTDQYAIETCNKNLSNKLQ